ncbi:MAG TPA: SDR family NAD(P)-dependent oxidoreductase, partial [Novosphingobium sp.]|nr:SDR family NAD(P)-dependent oxidoreductase [Novosphingobium sp.]
MKPISLEGQVVIVTGGAGALGSAYCREIARRGGLLLINDLGCSVPGEGSDASAAELMAEEIRSMGGQALANHDSVADSEGARRIVAAALDRFGRVDAVINSAGTMRFGPFEEVTAEDFAAVVDTHLVGSFHIASAVWPHMKAQGHGRIVLTASAAGLFGNRQMAAYASAKAGVAGLLNVLALEGE